MITILIMMMVLTVIVNDHGNNTNHGSNRNGNNSNKTSKANNRSHGNDKNYSTNNDNTRVVIFGVVIASLHSSIGFNGIIWGSSLDSS